ncbi:MAG TPA: LPXTG cell wall anchor domain-containing protein [Bryobacteraceae bacterium]|nr:LPXTG cell wall anchor domain-containing protein [Bryobacteraceae bacterium]
MDDVTIVRIVAGTLALLLLFVLVQRRRKRAS